MTDVSTSTKTPGKFDPTESTRTLVSSPFEEQSMTLREHQDADRHWIGDSLPIPAPEMATSIGTNNGTGTSPFPARADHAHELRTVYGHYDTNGEVWCPPGRTFINNLRHTGWGRNMLASPQIIAFPMNGLWRIDANIYINRDGGGVFTNEVNFLAFFFNGAASKVLLRQYNGGMAVFYIVETIDYFLASGAPSINDNWQLAVEHNDNANWRVSLQFLEVVRVCSHFSA